MSYKDVFRHIKEETIEATRELIDQKPWRGNPGHPLGGTPDDFMNSLAAFNDWLERVSEIYNIDTPGLLVDEEVRNISGYGHYSLRENRIYLPKFSVFTLAHEFRHAMQSQIPDLRLYRGDIEEDARAWSVSLIFRANPGFYNRAKEKGIILFS